MEGAADAGKAILTGSQVVPAPGADEDFDGPAAIFLQHRPHMVIDGLESEIQAAGPYRRAERAASLWRTPTTRMAENRAGSSWTMRAGRRTWGAFERVSGAVGPAD